MTPTMTIDLVQTLIYLGITAGGYMISHYNVLGKLFGTQGTIQVPPLQPPPPIPPSTAPSDAMKIVEQQLLAILAKLANNMIQGQNPSPTNPQPPVQPK
jgi:hypothetical protein